MSGTPQPPADPPAAPDSPGPPLRVSHGLAALALSLLLGLQPVTTDIYLPALPMLTRELAAPMHQAQLTMSALILAFGMAQMVWGPIADRVGRRPVLLIGLSLYNLASIGRHPVFVSWALLVSCTYGGLFTLLAASSFIYIEVLGLSPAAYGMAMATGSFSYLTGTFVCRRWIRRYGTAGTVQRGACFTLVGGLTMALLAAFGVQAVWAVLIPQCLYTFGHGLHQPCGQAGVVGPFPKSAGAASALSGFVLALVAFGIGQWLGVALDGTVRPLAYGLAFWAVATTAVAWLLVRRHG